MLLGNAITLAHELGLYKQSEQDFVNETSSLERHIRRLLFLFDSQLSLRLGCTSILPHVGTQLMTDTKSTDTSTNDEHILLPKWIEITKLLRTATDIFFANKNATRQMLRTSQYISYLDHFAPLLAKLLGEFATTNECGEPSFPSKKSLFADGPSCLSFSCPYYPHGRVSLRTGIHQLNCNAGPCGTRK